MANYGAILCLLVISFTMVVAIPVANVTKDCECKYNEKLNLTELLCNAKNLNSLPDFGDIDCVFDKVVISYNDISVLSNDSFVETPDLTIVHLFTNNINDIEEAAFRSLTNLREVDLSDNDLVTFDPWLFSENAELETVVLSDNPLVNLDELSPILSSKSVTTLLLDECKLTTLTREMLSELPNLQKLDISSNDIKSLQLSVFDDVPKLNRLELHNNRWKCDCNLKYLLIYADRIREDKTVPLIPVKCFTAEHEMVTWSDAVADKYCRPGEIDIEVIEDDSVDVVVDVDSVLIVEDDSVEVVVDVDVVEDDESSTEVILLAENSFVTTVASYLDSIYSFLIILSLLILTISLTTWIMRKVRREQRAQQVIPTASRTANKDNKFYMMNVHSQASAFTSTDQLLPNAESRDPTNMIVPLYSDNLPIVFQYPARSYVHIYETVRGDGN